MPQTPTVTAGFALKKLADGNLRFLSNQAEHPRQSSARRKELAAAQHPFAVILTCSDSRVSPELLFDQGFGDLYVIRNAGNLVSDPVLGSLEHAAGLLRTPLVVVMGHTRCGAVTAAVEARGTASVPIKSGLGPGTDVSSSGAASTGSGEAPGNLESALSGHFSSIVQAIQPAVEAASGQFGDPVTNAVLTNVRLMVEKIQTSQPYLAGLVQEKKLTVVGALCHIETGKVEFL